jgi:hypothetical protein
MNPIERLKAIDNSKFKTVAINLEKAIKENMKSNIEQALFDCETLSIVEDVKSRKIISLTDNEKAVMKKNINILNEAHSYVARGDYNGTRLRSRN